jgi:heme/copper-type cytochrome/quinol oxidase subunit 2
MRQIAIAGLFAALCVAALAGRSSAEGFASDVTTVQVVSANVGGKNVFIPSTIVVVAGKPVTLSIFNTTDVPHGFAIPALGVSEVLQPQVEHPVKLPTLKPNQVYNINCQLHPAHRTATLVVLPGS